MKDRYFITIVVPGMKFQGDTLDRVSLGGSETACASLSRELAKLGNTVKVFSNCDKPGDYDGVTYLPLAGFQAAMETMPGDVLIAQRTPDPFVSRSSHRLHLLWCHDLALGRQANSFQSICWNLDRFITVSRWMKEQYQSVYGLSADMIYASRNGIDLWRFPTVDLSKKSRKRLVYSARPERGLDVLLNRIFPELLKRDPEFELALFGYDNPVEHMQELYQSLALKSKQFGDKVRFMGNLTKNELYKCYADFGIYVYPTQSPMFSEFSEVSCISAMESMAAGMPIVTSCRGALPETIPAGAGQLIGGNPMSDEYISAFVEAVMGYANDPSKYDAAAQIGMAHAQQNLGWDKVAEDWTEQFGRWMAECNNDRTRLAHHFYRRSDIFAAKAALEGRTDPAALALSDKIAKENAFTETQESLKAHYIEGGKATDVRLASDPIENYNFNVTNETRFTAIEGFLNRHPECVRILDYGCGHGWSTLYLGNKVEGRSWTGVDLDPGAIAWAFKFSQHHGKPGVAYTFVEGDHTIDLKSDEPFDCLIMSEVLEHCRDPYETFEAVEKNVKLDGSVIITVPFGPSEFYTDNWHHFRNHLWEFDQHDLWDMFGTKPDYAVSSAAIYPNATTGEMTGYYFITFRADHKPLGRIDMARKLRLQRPRETVSASIIAWRNAEQTLGWCLSSIQPFVDEIVIADTGLSDLGRTIASHYGARLIPGSDPLKTGVEKPRNEALAQCRMDWVFWIDTDEKLLGGTSLMKYLRHNQWNGFFFKKHNFFTDKPCQRLC